MESLLVAPSKATVQARFGKTCTTASASSLFICPENVRELRTLLERAVLQKFAALKQLANAHQGSRVELARKLGISERSLYRKLKALNF